MTTAVWCKGVLAADRQRNTANGKMTASKIHFDVGKYAAFVGAGESWMIHDVVDWLAKGAKKSDRPNFAEDDVHGILVTKSGEAFFLSGKRPIILPIKDPFYAIGSGGDFATGAMAAGVDAKTAIEIASRYCRNTGMGVDCWTFVKARKK